MRQAASQTEGREGGDQESSKAKLVLLLWYLGGDTRNGLFLAFPASSLPPARPPAPSRRRRALTFSSVRAVSGLVRRKVQARPTNSTKVCWIQAGLMPDQTSYFFFFICQNIANVPE